MCEHLRYTSTHSSYLKPKHSMLTPCCCSEARQHLPLTALSRGRMVPQLPGTALTQWLLRTDHWFIMLACMNQLQTCTLRALESLRRTTKQGPEAQGIKTEGTLGCAATGSLSKKGPYRGFGILLINLLTQPLCSNAPQRQPHVPLGSSCSASKYQQGSPIPLLTSLHLWWFVTLGRFLTCAGSRAQVRSLPTAPP